MQKQLDHLMQKDMTRKEFITAASFGLASLFGFSTIVKLLTGKKSSVVHKKITTVGSGYGALPYGGGKD